MLFRARESYLVDGTVVTKELEKTTTVCTTCLLLFTMCFACVDTSKDYFTKTIKKLPRGTVSYCFPGFPGGPPEVPRVPWGPFLEGS